MSYDLSEVGPRRAMLLDGLNKSIQALETFDLVGVTDLGAIERAA